MSQSFTQVPAQAPIDAKYLVQTANGTLTAEQDLSALSTGYRKNTTTTGAQSIQAVPIPVADGGTNNTATPNTNGVAYKDSTKYTNTAEGATGTVLHGNTGAAPSYSAVSLTADVTGTLPIANGGTNRATAYTSGSVIFSSGTAFNQDNANLFYDDTNNDLILGGTSAATADIFLGDDGATIFNEQGTGALRFKVEGDTKTNLFVAQSTSDIVSMSHVNGGDGQLAEFNTSGINFNDEGSDIDFRVEGDTQENLLFTDASTDRVGIRTNTPASTLHVNGGISFIVATKTVNYTILPNDFCILADADEQAAGVTITLPTAGTAGRMYVIKKIGANALRTVTVDANGVETIDGELNVILVNQWECVWLMANGGTNWMILHRI